MSPSLMKRSRLPARQSDASRPGHQRPRVRLGLVWPAGRNHRRRQGRRADPSEALCAGPFVRGERVLPVASTGSARRSDVNYGDRTAAIAMIAASLAGGRFEPGQRVNLLTGGGVQRHYPPAGFRPEIPRTGCQSGFAHQSRSRQLRPDTPDEPSPPRHPRHDARSRALGHAHHR